jgi:hypothetical protein
VACGDLVGVMRSRSATCRRMKSGGKKRSYVHNTKRVGTAGNTSSGHGSRMAAG